MDDQLGPSIIAIFIEETLLPSKVNLKKFNVIKIRIDLKKSILFKDQIDLLTRKLTINEKRYSEKIERNILVVLSCLSEKIAGTSIASILSEKTIDFTLNCLVR